jgi:hypothetical protein
MFVYISIELFTLGYPARMVSTGRKLIEHLVLVLTEHILLCTLNEKSNEYSFYYKYAKILLKLIYQYICIWWIFLNIRSQLKSTMLNILGMETHRKWEHLLCMTTQSTNQVKHSEWADICGNHQNVSGWKNVSQIYGSWDIPAILKL